VSVCEVQAQITAVQAQQQALETDHQDYQHSLHALSQAIHPFHLNTCESQFGLELPTVLQAPLQRLADLSQTYAPTQSQAALDRWQRQIPDLSRTLHAWWEWVIQALMSQTQDPDIQDWVLSALLPWVYWHQQTQQTRQPQLKQGYQQAAQQAQARFLADGFTQTLPNSLATAVGRLGNLDVCQVKSVRPLLLKDVMAIYRVFIMPIGALLNRH